MRRWAARAKRRRRSRRRATRAPAGRRAWAARRGRPQRPGVGGRRRERDERQAEQRPPPSDRQADEPRRHGDGGDARQQLRDERGGRRHADRGVLVGRSRKHLELRREEQHAERVQEAREHRRRDEVNVPREAQRADDALDRRGEQHDKGQQLRPVGRDEDAERHRARRPRRPSRPAASQRRRRRADRDTHSNTRRYIDADDRRARDRLRQHGEGDGEAGERVLDGTGLLERGGSGAAASGDSSTWLATPSSVWQSGDGERIRTVHISFRAAQRPARRLRGYSVRDCAQRRGVARSTRRQGSESSPWIRLPTRRKSRSRFASRFFHAQLRLPFPRFRAPAPALADRRAAGVGAVACPGSRARRAAGAGRHDRGRRRRLRVRLRRRRAGELRGDRAATGAAPGRAAAAAAAPGRAPRPSRCPSRRTRRRAPRWPPSARGRAGRRSLRRARARGARARGGAERGVRSDHGGRFAGVLAGVGAQKQTAQF